MIDALGRAHSAGDVEAARKIAAMIQGAPPQAQPAAAPAEKPGLMASISQAMTGNITFAKAMAQGLPGIGGWTDELAAKAITALHGGDEEQNRRDYMAPVEAMPAGRRTAAELAGGVAGGVGLAAALPATVASIPAALATATGLGAIEGAGRNQDDRAEGALGGAASGLAGGTFGLAAGHLIARGGHALANQIRAAMGRPQNPFTGPVGQGAQQVLRESAETGARVNPGAPALTAAQPLAEQPLMEAAGRSVLAGGGKNAATLAGVGKQIIERGQAEKKAAGELYQSVLGIPAMSAKTRAADVVQAPLVSSQRVQDLLDNNKHVQRAMKRTADNLAFQNIAPTNLARLQAVKADLAAKARTLAKKSSVQSDGVRQAADELDQALADAVPHYREVTERYAKAAAAAQAKKTAGEAMGGKKTFIPIEDKRSLIRMLHNLVSGSVQGAMIRGGVGASVETSGALIRRTQGKIAERIVDILKETDPAKIQAAIAALNKDTTGRPLRPALVFQGPNALAAWQREEQQ